VELIEGDGVLSFAAILFLGFLLGMRHATDPDHVVAITTIVAKQRGIGKAGIVGALWGLGHTFTIFVVGTTIILFQVTIPPRIGLSMEFAVAAMLILLGILNLTGKLRRLQEKLFAKSPEPRTGTKLQTANLNLLQTSGKSAPLQNKAQGSSSRFIQAIHGMGVYNLLRPLIIGVVHGLAGSAAVALLVMATIRNPWWSIGYLLLFGLGTVAGMMLITSLIAMPLTLTSSRFSGLNRGMGFASGVLSLGFGLFLAYQIGFVDGLFTGHVRWTPQ
jgi:high-affinity nickel permease